ncbi:CDP-diacylglycerol--serine O-phosphatidyltransferase [Salirhabdus euzebyi]|uniref:CDP-diacylglycerol--serine O-phosphatidyltransferase n=1 Tax=Salirhabdus euzebyi TaxID=394506 RepID=A0A841Q4J5_9BACI|nr:CDP-diacylglycerol--serine O-phosphatidyltransferase [Salirhabdus euzebyi]MBB6453272.1 CDP-diacylglycerol--serine O-phosphatidyltransferase [Salirhabdus euzebyi]
MFLSERIDHTIKQIKEQTANIVTLSNLSLGILAIVFMFNEMAHISVLMIFLAVLTDWFDGKIARKLNITSEFGKQLDSLCDLVSFGIAPALLVYQTTISAFGVPGIWVTVIYILAGAIRLARFNVMTFNGRFVGLPITAAGCLLTLCYAAMPFIPAPMYMVLMIVLSFLMISTIEVKKY